MKTPLTLLAALTFAVGLALPTLAEQQTITVAAMGEAKFKPDTLVLSGQISETNEKLKDAVTGFNDTRRRAMAAITELGIENISVTSSALSMSISGNPMAGPFGGGDVEVATPGALVISQSVTLSVSGIDQMEEKAVIDLVVKLMEGVKEAGVDLTSMDAQTMMLMQMGMGGEAGGSATFKISDPKAAIKAATKDAVDKARADAAYLAELAGGKLGPVVRISDGGMPAGSDDSAMNPYMMIFGAMMDEEQAEPYSSKTLDPITVVRPLSVSFQLITE